ncbi:MAG: hypothetical protein JWR16_3533 [Nevskia sp.]|nr:hypothetical protein [Nevskia sp.]
MLLALSLPTGKLCAQGGPPMVTDDPDTPGDNHWEINLAAEAQRTRGVWNYDLPDADINYGLGEHLQLKIDTPWALQANDGAGVHSGLGTTELGVKWRFVDREQAGFSASIYPQLSINLMQSSPRRGLTEPGKSWFLPLEISTEFDGFGLAAEAGRDISAHGGDQWIGGGVLAHACPAGIECLLEVHQRWSRSDPQTLLSLGMRRELSKTFVLLAAFAREVGPQTDDRLNFSAYLGVQILR